MFLRDVAMLVGWRGWFKYFQSSPHRRPFLVSRLEYPSVSGNSCRRRRKAGDELSHRHSFLQGTALENKLQLLICTKPLACVKSLLSLVLNIWFFHLWGCEAITAPNRLGKRCFSPVYRLVNTIPCPFKIRIKKVPKLQCSFL